MRTDESDGIMGTDNSVMSTDEYIYLQFVYAYSFYESFIRQMYVNGHG